MRICSKAGVSNKPYKPTPQKTAVFTQEQVAEAKRRVTQRRRAIEDAQIDREVEERVR